MITMRERRAVREAMRAVERAAPAKKLVGAPHCRSHVIKVGMEQAMFTDEAAILQAAATLAAVVHTVRSAEATSGNRRYTDSPVDALINVLREMEAKKIIAPGLVGTKS
jgi:CO dehydrogenase/acetyl-CoA synthase alpha subunit